MSEQPSPDLKECAKLARKICRRKFAHRELVRTEYVDGVPSARFRSLIRDHEWTTPLETLRRI